MANRFLSNVKINDAYTFPASDGTNGQVITTDGAGNLSFQSAGEAGATVIYKDLFTGNASTVVFTLANSVDNEVKTQVYFDGVYQSKENYTVSGNAITFSTAPPSGAAIEVITFATVAAADYNQKLNFYGKAVGTIAKGDAVMFAGAQGDHFLITKATQAGLDANHEYFLGLAAQDFANNQYGYVTQFGRLEGMDTSSYIVGDILWFDSEGTVAGAVTTTEPSAPNTKIQIAAIVRVHQNEGVIFVRPTVFHELSESTDVSITSAADKDLLAWNSLNGVWENTKTLGDITTGNITTAGTVDGVDVSTFKSAYDSHNHDLLYLPIDHDMTLTLGGDLSGSVTFTDMGNATLTATIAANSVALGTDTTGNYMVNVSAGSGISVSHIQSEGSTATISHADTSSAATLTASGRTYVTGLTFDTFGHVTAYTTGTETVVDTNTTYTAGSGLSLAGTVFSHSDTSSAANLTASGRTYVTGLTFDTYGHVTGYTTGTETVVDTNTTYTAGGGLSLAGTVFSHTDTSSQASVNNSNGTVIQDVTLDTYGHVTGLASVDLDLRYLGISAKAADSNLLDGLDSTAFLRNSGIVEHSGLVYFTGTGSTSGIRFNSTIVSNDAFGIRVNGTSNAGELEFYSTDDDTEPFVFRHYTVGQDGTGTSVEWFRIGAGGNVSTPGTVTAGSFSGSLSGNATTATTLQTARTISLTGDVTGSVSFNGSANVSITATVADDSHNHVYGNIDGMSVGSIVGPRFTTPSGYIEFGPANTTWAHIYTDRPNFYLNKDMYVLGNRMFHDGYHPNADTLTTARTINGTSFNGSADITTANWGTARTLTIGSTGKSVNGSANVSWSLAEIGALGATAKAADSELLDGLNSTYFDHRRYTDSSNYLGGFYVSGGAEKPNNTVFGAGKFKVAMLSGSNLGFGGSWNDVMWISTYSGGDVKSSHALVFDKYSSNVWVSDQNFDSASWGTGYLIITSANIGSQSVSYAANAGTLDSIDSSQFLRSDANDTLSGTITLSYSQPKFVFSDTVSGRSATIGMTDNYNMYLTSANGGNLYLGSGTTTFINGTSDSSVSSKAPIFYDSNNTGYFADPDNNSVLQRLTLGSGTTSVKRLYVQETEFANNPMFMRAGRTTDVGWNVAKFAAQKTTAIGNGFGATISFHISDTTVTEQNLGELQYLRKNNSTSGQFTVTTSNTGAGYRRFYIEPAGYVYLGEGLGEGNHVIRRNTSQGNPVLTVSAAGTSIEGTVGTTSDTAEFFAVSGSGANAASTAIKVGRNSSTLRSINAAGTINASGADYAEYMTKAVEDAISKGDVVGVDSNGELTNVYADSISFVVKSTDPSYVGNDTWYKNSILKAPTKPLNTDFKTGEIDDNGIDIVDNDALEKAYKEYELLFAEYMEELETIRAKVDRIAFSGQVPCNVYNASVGDYIIASPDANGKIIGTAVTSPTFEQYMASVGRVWKIMDDGRAWIAVKIS